MAKKSSNPSSRSDTEKGDAAPKKHGDHTASTTIAETNKATRIRETGKDLPEQSAKKVDQRKT